MAMKKKMKEKRRLIGIMVLGGPKIISILSLNLFDS